VLPSTGPWFWEDFYGEGHLIANKYLKYPIKRHV
jgi:hypothetical protein